MRWAAMILSAVLILVGALFVIRNVTAGGKRAVIDATGSGVGISAEQHRVAHRRLLLGASLIIAGDLLGILVSYWWP